MSRPNDALPLGGVLVGGQSRRFGSDKAAARVGDRSMVVRALDTLRAASDPVVLLGGDGAMARRLGLPWRADDRPGRGPLAGLATGLRWAEELGRAGVLLLACDLPLVTARALRTIAGAARPDLDAVVAASRADPGVQPLCGWYATAVLPSVVEALDAGRLSARALLDELRVERIDLDDGSDDPDLMLLNVNTPGDLARAARHATAERVR